MARVELVSVVFIGLAALYLTSAVDAARLKKAKNGSSTQNFAIENFYVASGRDISVEVNRPAHQQRSMEPGVSVERLFLPQMDISTDSFWGTSDGSIWTLSQFDDKSRWSFEDDDHDVKTPPMTESDVFEMIRDKPLWRLNPAHDDWRHFKQYSEGTRSTEPWFEGIEKSREELVHDLPETREDWQEQMYEPPRNINRAALQAIRTEHKSSTHSGMEVDNILEVARPFFKPGWKLRRSVKKDRLYIHNAWKPHSNFWKPPNDAFIDRTPKFLRSAAQSGFASAADNIVTDEDLLFSDRQGCACSKSRAVWLAVAAGTVSLSATG